MMTIKYPAARATILAAVDAAAAAWAGLEWDSAPQTLRAAVEAGRAIDLDDLGGFYWPADGSHQSQELQRAWSALIAEVADQEAAPRGRREYSAQVVAEARRLADAEAAAVQALAAAAAEFGRRAVDHVGEGHWADALVAAYDAAATERRCGDAPAWDSVASEIKRLPEFFGFQAAVSVEVVEVLDVGDRDAMEALEALINAIESRDLGRTEANAEEWDARFLSAYAVELREWAGASPSPVA